MVHHSFMNEEPDGIPVYRAPGQNLQAAAILADSLAPLADGPAWEGHRRLTTYLRMTVEQQNVVTSS